MVWHKETALTRLTKEEKSKNPEKKKILSSEQEIIEHHLMLSDEKCSTFGFPFCGG